MMGEIAATKKMRDAIHRYEDFLCKHEPMDLPPIHHFCEGVYMRELHIPADTYLTGCIHKRGCLNIVAKGKAEVATEDGAEIIEAPAIFKTRPGLKRALHVITDMIWITVHQNPDNEEKTDEELRLEHTVPDYNLLDEIV